MSNEAREISIELESDGRVNPSNIVLCVDMDGTLITTDAAIECLSEIIKKRPLLLIAMPFWLMKGIAFFKWQLAKKAKIDCSKLPFNRKVLRFLMREKESGRQIVLATGANRIIADGVAKHLGIFSAVHASSMSHNLVGQAKADLLVTEYGRSNFDYAGDSSKDLYVWSAASTAIVVNATRHLAATVIRQKPNHRVLSLRASLVKSVVRVVRPHQWAKNVLVFVPMILANRLEFDLQTQAFIAFISFSLIASAGYVFNDLLDLASDRAHDEKCKRPFASGDLSVLTGFALIPLLVVGSFVAASFIGPIFAALVAAYFVLTTVYSIKLKRVVIADVIVLSGFYSMRIYAGSLATHVTQSIWLLAFSTFFFLNLAFIKRSAELVKKISAGDSSPMGRGYELADHPQLSVLGSVSGYISVLVLALYINSDAVRNLYKAPEFLWISCLVLMYWVSRIWLLTNRGQMSHDPVLFALRDSASWISAGIVAISWSLARGLIL
jgi:4-hydroxybenzoate polyprenyltransferase/phosphoserine phosphatase